MQKQVSVARERTRLRISQLSTDTCTPLTHATHRYPPPRNAQIPASPHSFPAHPFLPRPPTPYACLQAVDHWLLLFGGNGDIVDDPPLFGRARGP